MPGQQQAMNLLCDGCNATLNEDEQDSGHVYCEDCIEDNSWQCESCMEVFLDPNASVSMRNSIDMPIAYATSTIDTSEIMCRDCFSSCNNCGEVYADWDNASECCNEYGGSIHSWDYRPDFKFYVEPGVFSRYPQRDVLYMGMELEVERMASIADDFLMNAKEYDYSNPQFVYLKTDGSLSGSGVEVVTMPATLDAFRGLWPQDAMRTAHIDGARSFHYHNCGIHIHVSRTSFTPSHMWKFVRFQMRNPILCQIIGQRDESSYATWFGLNDSLNELPKIVKGESQNRSRYVALNFQRRDTVELRYFKGNVLFEGIMKNLEFVDSVYEYTKQLTIPDIYRGGMSRGSYMKWLYEQDTTRYDNLKQFIDKTHKEAN